MLHLLLLTLLAPALVVGNDVERLATSDLNDGSDLADLGDPGPSSRINGIKSKKGGPFKSTVFVYNEYWFLDKESLNKLIGHVTSCTGVIVSPKWVLTSLSCLPCPFVYNIKNPGRHRYKMEEETMYVRVACDPLKIRAGAGCLKYNVLYYYAHPSAQASVKTCSKEGRVVEAEGDNQFSIDLAVLNVKRNIDFIDFVGSSLYKEDNFSYKIGCIALGFGNLIDINNCSSSRKIKFNNTLHYTHVPAGNEDFCRSLLPESELDKEFLRRPGQDDSSYICAYNKDSPGKTGFSGDRGSALLCPDQESGQFVVVGVYSRSAKPRGNVTNGVELPCGFKDTVMIYTSLQGMVKWINETMKRHSW